MNLIRDFIRIRFRENIIKIDVYVFMNKTDLNLLKMSVCCLRLNSRWNFQQTLLRLTTDRKRFLSFAPLADYISFCGMLQPSERRGLYGKMDIAALISPALPFFLYN